MAVIEVGGDRDHRLLNLLAQMILGGLLQLLEDQGRNLGRGIFLPLGQDSHVVVGRPDHLIGNLLDLARNFLEAAAHEALDRVDRILRIRDSLTLGNLADQALAFLGKGHDRGRCPSPFFVGDDDRIVAFHHRHDGIRGTQVNSYDLSHFFYSLI
jgi:hypothetical protein